MSGKGIGNACLATVSGGAAYLWAKLTTTSPPKTVLLVGSPSHVLSTQVTRRLAFEVHSHSRTEKSGHGQS